MSILSLKNRLVILFFKGDMLPREKRFDVLRWTPDVFMVRLYVKLFALRPVRSIPKYYSEVSNIKRKTNFNNKPLKIFFQITE